MIDYAAREQYRKERNAAGVCRDCDNHSHGKTRCPSCMQKSTAARRKKVAELTAEEHALYRAPRNERLRELRRIDPDRYRGYDLKKHYGLTQGDYDRILAEQGGGCASCGCAETEKGKKYLHIDHDHRTGRVRALLCQGCNKALGYLREDPERIRKLAEYIQRYRLVAV